MDKTTQERIKADAEDATEKRFPGDAANFEYLEYEAGYIAGATAEADNAAKAISLIWFALKEKKDIDYAIKLCENQLQQWKGEKEVGDGIH